MLIIKRAEGYQLNENNYYPILNKVGSYVRIFIKGLTYLPREMRNKNITHDGKWPIYGQFDIGPAGAEVQGQTS